MKIDPNNHEAKQGLERVKKLFFVSLSNLITNGDNKNALEKLNLAKSIWPNEKKLNQKFEKEINSLIATNDESKNVVYSSKENIFKKQRVDSLLARAQTAFQEDNFISPQSENAFTLYSAALSLDPSNQRARSGIANITTYYLKQTADALSKKQYSTADKFLKIISKIDNNNPDLARLKKEIRQKRNSQTNPINEIQDDQQNSQIGVIGQNAQTINELDLNKGIIEYYKGNYQKAFRLLKPLADQGSLRAKIRVARMLYRARGVLKNEAMAIEIFRFTLPLIQQAANQGTAWAQSDLADFYFDGIVINKDTKRAHFWYEQSALQGYAPAQTNLGFLYITGYDDIEPNRARAIDWFNAAAQQGNRAAIENLKILSR